MEGVFLFVIWLRRNWISVTFRQIIRWNDRFIWRINPYHWIVIIKNTTVFNLRSGFHLSAIEPIRGKAHNLFIHTILHLQQRHYLWFILYNAFHQGLTQASTQSSYAFYSRWELTMITRKDDSRCPTNGYPTGRFKGLCSLIDKQSRKLLTFHYPAVCTNKGRSNDTCLSKQFCIDTYFKLSGTALQSIHLLMIAFRTFLSVVPQFSNSLSNRP